MNWEQVERGRPAAVSQKPASTFFERLFGSEESLDLPDFQPQDMQQIAALPFVQKHRWFVEMLGRMQRPWSDGHIRIEVSVCSFSPSVSSSLILQLLCLYYL